MKHFINYQLFLRSKIDSIVYDVQYWFYRVGQKLKKIPPKIKRLLCYVGIHQYSRVHNYPTATIDICLKCGKNKRKLIY